VGAKKIAAAKRAKQNATVRKELHKVYAADSAPEPIPAPAPMPCIMPGSMPGSGSSD